MKKIVFMLATVLLLMACNTEKKVEKKSLVVYYSITSTTKSAADYIQQQTGADIAELKAKVPYSTNYPEIITRSQQEMQNNTLPEMEQLTVDIANYDTIFVGYPIWYGTYALPMKSWLSNVDLKGKVIVPFATFGSGGYAKSLADFKEQQPEAQIIEGFGIRSALKDMLPTVADDMLMRIGAKAGEPEQKGEFSTPKSVEQAEIDIFNKAVEGYQMLNATPLTVGSREVKAGTEYCFEAENVGPNGTKMKVKVYVTKENGDKAPYFTLVDYPKES